MSEREDSVSQQKNFLNESAWVIGRYDLACKPDRRTVTVLLLFKSALTVWREKKTVQAFIPSPVPYFHLSPERKNLLLVNAAWQK